jgi:preprotein translocase subunit SecB
MPAKPQKTAKKPIKKPKKAAPPVKLLESFIRDLSLECFIAPSGQPSKDREMDFTLSRAIRKEGQNRMCVDIALQLRVSPRGATPFVVAEMIYENVYNVTGENSQIEAWLNEEASHETYQNARKTMLDVLGRSGLNPPLPTTVNFKEVSQQSNAK